MASDFQVNEYLQAELERRGLAEVSAVDAAEWLDAAGILPNSKDRPGRELRRLLRNDKIVGARREMNNRWFIERRSPSAEEPCCVKRLVEMDSTLLSRHIEFFDDACAHWTRELIDAPPIVLGDVVRKEVPQTAGVYVVRNNGELVYIGKSGNLCTRICSQHLGPRKRSSTLRRKVSKHLRTDDEERITEWLRTATIAWIGLGHHGLALAVEDCAIAKYDPPFNGYT